MKLRFKRNVTADFCPQRTGDWVERTFKEGEELDLTNGDVYISSGGWADISLSNGDLVESVLANSFEKIP